MTAETGTYRWMAPEVHFTCMWILSFLFMLFYMVVPWNVIGTYDLACHDFMFWLCLCLFLLSNWKRSFFYFLLTHTHTHTHTHTYSCFNYMKVIEHKPYDHKADVFSFGIVAWELLTGEVSTAVFRRKKKVIFFNFILLLTSYNCKNFTTYSLYFKTKITASLIILDPIASSSRCGAKGISILFILT